MNSSFKNSLNKVKADEELVYKTEQYLKNKLMDKQNDTLIRKIMLWVINKRTTKLRVSAISACIAVLLVVAGVKAYATPESYVNLDINPSVELGINLFGLVVTLEAYNEDGYTILEGVDVTGENVMDAVKILVNSAVNHSFIADDGSTVITITAETNNEVTARELNTDAEKGIQEALKENGKLAEIFKDNVDLAHRAEARQIGITPGKLNLIRKLQGIDPNVSIEQYKDVNTKDIMKIIIQAKGNKDNNRDKQDLNAGVDNQGNDDDVGNKNNKATDKNENPSAAAGNLNINDGKSILNPNAENGNNNSKSSQEKLNKDDSFHSQNLNNDEGNKKEKTSEKNEMPNTGNSKEKSDNADSKEKSDTADSKEKSDNVDSKEKSDTADGKEKSDTANSKEKSDNADGKEKSSTGNDNGKSYAGQGDQHKDK